MGSGNEPPGLARRLKGFRDLLAFMTGLPLGGGGLREAAVAFPLAPLVGIMEGLLASLAIMLMGKTGAPDLLVGGVYVAIHAALTGSIHLEGFADYSDVIGSRLGGDRALRVLKDPRRGSHSLVWVAILLLLSAASASSIYKGIVVFENGLLLYALLLAASHSASAESMYLVLALGTREPYEGLAATFKDSMDGVGHAMNVVVYATSSLALAWLALVVAGHHVAAIMAIVLLQPAVVAVAVARDAGLRLGFVNGDVTGFAYEVSRTLALATLAIAIGA